MKTQTQADIAAVAPSLSIAHSFNTDGKSWHSSLVSATMVLNGEILTKEAGIKKDGIYKGNQQLPFEMSLTEEALKRLESKILEEIVHVERHEQGQMLLEEIAKAFKVLFD